MASGMGIMTEEVMGASEFLVVVGECEDAFGAGIGHDSGLHRSCIRW